MKDKFYTVSHDPKDAPYYTDRAYILKSPIHELKELVAICDDESKCPHCGIEVTPRSHKGRWEIAMQKLYGLKKLKEMRAGYKDR